MEGKLIVIAIGGNSLIEDPKNVTVSSQYEAARKTASSIAELVSQGHRIVIVHGNGPQVGYILRRAEYSRPILHHVPLDSCVADTQGAIGYQLQMALGNELSKRGMNVPVSTVVTQVEVSGEDPAFENPSKPIGGFMSAEDALYHRINDGWAVKEDSGRGYRRLVPSPKPMHIVEMESIRVLSESGCVVIAAGGGGIPVCRDEDGQLGAVEAVVDKDLAGALLAKKLNADMFLISTAVEKVCLNYNSPEQKTIDSMTTSQALSYMEEGHFAPGSMLPKVQAMVDFVTTTGNQGIITDPCHIALALEGKAGTLITKDFI